MEIRSTKGKKTAITLKMPVTTDRQRMGERKS